MKHSLTLSLLLGIATCSPIVHAETSACEVHMAAGDDAWSVGDYHLANKNYSIALRESDRPGTNNLQVARLLGSLASTYILDKRGEEAKPLLDRAIKIWDTQFRTGKHTSGHQETVININNIGVTCLNHNMIEAAENMFAEAIKLDPKYSLAYSNRAIARGMQGNFKGADDDYEQYARTLGGHIIRLLHSAAVDPKTTRIIRDFGSEFTEALAHARTAGETREDCIRRLIPGIKQPDVTRLLELGTPGAK